jgi:type IV secretory pathway TraG/TraD family ATPase VirD4
MAVFAAERTIHKQRGSTPRPRFLCIDEANQVKARPIILTLLQKARAAGITVILATQSPTDWIDELGDDWDSMATNCNTALVLSQGARGPAEMCAELIGKERRMVAGLQYLDGDVYDAGNLREEEDWRVTPDELRQLSIGEAIIRVGKPRERVTWMRVAMRDPSAHARGAKPIGPHPPLPGPGGQAVHMPPGSGSVGSSMPTPS